MLNNITPTRIAQHLLFWMTFLFYRLMASSIEKALIGDYWWGDWKIIHILFVHTICQAIFSYGLVYVLIPRFLDKEKYIQFGISFILWAYVGVGLFVAAHFYYLEKLYTLKMWYDEEAMLTMASRMTTFGFLLITYSHFIVPTLILGAIKFYRKKIKLAEIEDERNKMELKALKTQLNPHFLFNTLNNLYSYVVTQSEEAPEIIMRLSAMLDYVLYKSQNKIVVLEEEITTIQNFLNLEQMRYGERLEVDFSVIGNVSVPIAPLLLLSVVENAFKHGASGDIENPKISIFIENKNGLINCEVHNTKSKQIGELNDDYKEGIGLSNIKRQLNLIYPDTHTINIEDNENDFKLSLSIKHAS